MGHGMPPALSMELLFMTLDPASRRCFLKVLAQGGALAGAACLGVGCAAGGPLAAGNVKDFPAGTLKGVGQSVAVGHDAKGLYALSTICPHASCDMESQGSISANGLTCSCHGSAFDANGAVLQGPARTALEHFAVTVDGAGEITVDVGSTVDAARRTPVT
jgi:nitrite reductase/ring-hydroxylating ferredoxin subunit